LGTLPGGQEVGKAEGAGELRRGFAVGAEGGGSACRLGSMDQDRFPVTGLFGVVGEAGWVTGVSGRADEGRQGAGVEADEAGG